MANLDDKIVAAIKRLLPQVIKDFLDKNDPRDADGDGKVTWREVVAAKRQARKDARQARKDKHAEAKARVADRKAKREAEPDALEKFAAEGVIARAKEKAFLEGDIPLAHSDVLDAMKNAQDAGKRIFGPNDVADVGDAGINPFIGHVQIDWNQENTKIERPAEENNRNNIGKATNLNPQPGYLVIRAEDECGARKCFGVLGFEDEDCGSGPAARTVWWEPNFGFGTGTGSGEHKACGEGGSLDDGDPALKIAKGFNLVPSSNSYGEHHPTTLWKDLYTAANGPHALAPGETNYIWVKITYSERDVLVADKIWQVYGKEDYDIDVNFDFEFEFTGSGSGTGTGSVHGGLDCGDGAGTGVGEGEEDDCHCCDVPVTGIAYFTGDNSLKVEVAGEGTGSGTGSGSGYTYKPGTFDGSIKQYMLYTSTAPEVVTPITTESVAPEDTKLEKYQLLGQVTLDDKGNVTAWEWRMNHAFYWNAPDFVAGTLGKTKTTLPSYSAPRIETP